MNNKKQKRQNIEGLPNWVFWLIIVLGIILFLLSIIGIWKVIKQNEAESNWLRKVHGNV